MPRVRKSAASVIAVVAALVLCGSVLPASAVDPPVVDWFIRSGAEISDVALDAEGGAVVVGTEKQSGSSDGSSVIARYGLSGELIWRDSWSPEQGFVFGNGVAVAQSGVAVAVGMVACDGYEAVGMFARAFGPGGEHLWTVTTEGGWCLDAVASERATDVAIAHGLVVVVGHEIGCCGMALDDGWIRAYDVDGSELWRKDFEVPGIPRRTNDSLQGVAATAAGFVVTGSVNMKPGHDTATPVDSEIVLQSIDVSGTVGWTTVLRDRGVKDGDIGYGVAVRGERIVAVGAWNRSRRTADRGWVGRFGVDGSLRWMREWGRHTATYGVAIGPDGVAWTLGSASDPADDGTDMLMRAYDLSGLPLWQVRRDTIGLWSTGTAVAPDDTGAFVTGAAGYRRDSGRLWHYVSP